MSLAPHVRTLGRGPGRSRNLTEAEAEEAMAAILDGRAEPEATGALLMLMRYRAEDAAEIAGFVRALRATLPAWPGSSPALDWPVYAAGRSRGLPWFLLAARCLAEAGWPVLLHGPEGPVTRGLEEAGITRAGSVAEASAALAGPGIAYLPLAPLCPGGARLLGLRAVLGLRSPINTALRMLNPAAAATSLQGVFHPPYRALQQDAAIRLGQPSSLVIKGGGGEFERHPAKGVALFGQRAGTPWADTAPPLLAEATRLEDGPALQGPGALAALWSGAARDGFAEAIVTGTMALALRALGAAPDSAAAEVEAARLWAARAGRAAA